MKNRIITIGREFGSGGRTIGKNVAKQLQIPCYDQEIIEKLIETSGFSESYLKDKSEYAHSNWVARAFSTNSMAQKSNQDAIWIAQREIILDIAKKGSCVIVGRCADYILEGKADLLKVFIHASLSKRIERVVNVYGETDVPTDKRLKDKDKRRAAYYQFYTDTKWGDVHNYHITLDSGSDVIGIEKCTEIITNLY